MRFALVFLALGSALSVADAQRYGYEERVRAEAPTNARVALAHMNAAERQNSRISVEFESRDSEAVELGHEVERLWNGGEHDEALAQLGSLEARVGYMAVGISWRNPVQTHDADWDEDVRIGNRDSLTDVALDMDTKDSNLFVVLRHGARAPHYSVCASFDGGATWMETFAWVGSPPTSVDVGAVSDYDLGYVYVAYNSPGENAQQVRLRRLLCSDGSAAAFPTGVMWIAPCTLAVGDTMKEVSLIGRAHGYTGGPHLVTLVSDGSVLYSGPYGVDVMNWSTRRAGVDSGASHGLDATGNQDRTTEPFFSCYGADDTIRVYSPVAGVFTRRFSYFAGPGTLTSVSARSDRIVCAFEDRTVLPHQVRCVVNTDNGETWTIGTLGDSSIPADAPAVMSRGRTGFGAVFRQSSPTLDLWFCQRADSGPWSDPASIADHEPYQCRPAIEDLGGGAFGVAYLSNSGPVGRGAFFDRSDWVYGIAEQSRLETREGMLSFTPNPLKGRVRLSCTLSHPADLRVQMYDHAGRLVRALFEGHSPAGRLTVAFAVSDVVPGVYFLRLDTPGFRAVKKAVVTR